MGQSDFSAVSDITSNSSIAREAVTAAVVPPPTGAGSFTFAAHSLVNAAGIAAFYSGLTDFSPMVSGGDVTGAVWKGGAGGNACSAFIFTCLNGQASTNSAYILGLSDSEPAHIILRKGQLAAGLPDVAPGTQGVLRRSTATYAKTTWVHLKLEAIEQPNGDVVLNVYQSTGDVTSPTWVAIAGMAAFTDDVLQVNTGTAPIAAGRSGFGCTTAEINRIAAFSAVTTDRQILP